MGSPSRADSSRVRTLLRRVDRLRRVARQPQRGGHARRLAHRIFPERKHAICANAGTLQGVEDCFCVDIRVTGDGRGDPFRPGKFAYQRLRPMPWLVDDHQARADGGEPLVAAALALVTGAHNDHGRLAGGHVFAQRGSSTTGVSPGGTRTPGAVLLRSSAGRRLGAASRASSSTWPSTRSTVVFISVVTVALRGA